MSNEHDHKAAFGSLLTAAVGTTSTVALGDGLYATSNTVIKKGIKPPKTLGWCEEQGIHHAWEQQDYVLTTNPPQVVRICLNCGKTQRRSTQVRVDEWR